MESPFAGELKRSFWILWLSFGYPFPFSTVLQRFSFLSLCQQPFSGAWMENDWRKIIICQGDQKETLFYLVMLALTFLAKIPVTFNCWFCLCPSSIKLLPHFLLCEVYQQQLIQCSLCDNLLMMLSSRFFTFTGINRNPYHSFYILYSHILVFYWEKKSLVK